MIPTSYAEIPSPTSYPELPSPTSSAASAPLVGPTWLDHDLAAAGEVQRRMLPPLERYWRGVEIGAEYRPAHQVGGDFFEVSTRPDGRLTAVVGDVAGKGIAAALIMARVSGEFRSVVRRVVRPSRILAAVNRWLDEQNLCDRFATAGCVALDLERSVWTAASAGHPAALLFRSQGAMEILGEAAGGPGLGLGCVERWRCSEHEVPALPGDTLLLMTDGVSDRLDPIDIGAAVLQAGNAGAALADLRRQIFDRLAAVPGPRDDATLLSLRLGSTPLGYC